MIANIHFDQVEGLEQTSRVLVRYQLSKLRSGEIDRYVAFIQRPYTADHGWVGLFQEIGDLYTIVGLQRFDGIQMSKSVHMCCCHEAERIERGNGRGVKIGVA